MGYYVTGDGFVSIKTNDIPSAYKALCDLNQRDDLKRGGSYGGGGIDQSSPRPDGLNYHPARWFSWMDANYPDTLHSVDEILTSLGFDFVIKVTGDETFYTLNYDNKIGQENEFFTALAPFIVSGEVYWRGEDGNHWMWKFEDGKLKWFDGEVTYTYYEAKS